MTPEQIDAALFQEVDEAADIYAVDVAVNSWLTRLNLFKKGNPMGMTIKLICQFCRKQYGVKEGFGVTGESHGICSSCKAAEKCPTCSFPVEYCRDHKTCAA